MTLNSFSIAANRLILIKRGMEAMNNLWLYSLAGLLGVGLILIVHPGTGWRFGSVQDNLFLALTCLFGFTFQFFYSLSCKYEKNSTVLSLIFSTMIIWTYLLDIVAMGTEYNLTAMIGCFLVFGSLQTIVVYSKKPVAATK